MFKRFLEKLTATQFPRIPLLALALVILTACTALEPVDPWPDNIPPREYFAQVYTQDRDNQSYQSVGEYMDWVLTFYQGNALSNGWLAMSREIVMASPEGQQASVLAELGSLGQRIAGEWAKDNRIRRIDTRSASIWREALVESLFQEDLDNFLQQLNRDVDALISDELLKEDISLGRYYQMEEEFFE